MATSFLTTTASRQITKNTSVGLDLNTLVPHILAPGAIAHEATNITGALRRLDIDLRTYHNTLWHMMRSGFHADDALDLTRLMLAKGISISYVAPAIPVARTISDNENLSLKEAFLKLINIAASGDSTSLAQLGIPAQLDNSGNGDRANANMSAILANIPERIIIMGEETANSTFGASKDFFIGLSNYNKLLFSELFTPPQTEHPLSMAAYDRLGWSGWKKEGTPDARKLPLRELFGMLESETARKKFIDRFDKTKGLYNNKKLSEEEYIVQLLKLHEDFIRHLTDITKYSFEGNEQSRFSNASPALSPVEVQYTKLKSFVDTMNLTAPLFADLAEIHKKAVLSSSLSDFDDQYAKLKSFVDAMNLTAPLFADLAEIHKKAVQSSLPSAPGTSQSAGEQASSRIQREQADRERSKEKADGSTNITIIIQNLNAEGSLKVSASQQQKISGELGVELAFEKKASQAARPDSGDPSQKTRQRAQGASSSPCCCCCSPDCKCSCSTATSPAGPQSPTKNTRTNDRLASQNSQAASSACYYCGSPDCSCSCRTFVGPPSPGKEHTCEAPLGNQMLGGVMAGMDKYVKDVGSVAEGMEKVVSGSLKNLEDAFVQFAMTGKLEFSTLIDSLLADMTRFFIQQAMSSFMKVAFLHTGGIAGVDASFSRPVSAAAFNNAPRYHRGGIVGLMPNEVPAILKRGESVFTQAQASSLAPLSAIRDTVAQGGVGVAYSPVNVVVNNTMSDSANVRIEEAPSANGGMQVEVLIDRRIDNYFSDGRSDRAMRRYGVRPIPNGR